MTILKDLGAIAGVGGIALGVFALIFRDVLRRIIFPRMTQQYGFRLLRLMLILTWSIAIFGVAVYVYSPRLGPKTAPDGTDSKVTYHDSIPPKK